jgi:hypothetical protein
MTNNSAIGKENEWEMANLLKILDDPATSYERRLDIAKAIIENDIGNPKAISALIVILENPALNYAMDLDWKYGRE